ncbi:MAG: T9SS outer membrane translocon Sov/SprA [Gemmatimonadota bacterium]
MTTTIGLLPNHLSLVRVVRALPLLLVILAPVVVTAQPPRRDSARVASPVPDTGLSGRDSTAASLAEALRQRVSALDGLTIRLDTRIEAKAQRTRNERCFASILFRAGFECRSPFTPSFDAEFGLATAGGFTDRTRIDVDYDTQREFDGSNSISLSYSGRPADWLQRVEVGNVSFLPPPSRFITSGIPAGNFGLQAAARFGPVNIQAIAAQQKGNVIGDQVFYVGARTTRLVDREIEDYQIEPRRFFFTVDPALLGPAWPNVDILNAAQMEAVARGLPDSLRPSRVLLYRLILGGQPPNPNGPRFQIIGDPLSGGGAGGTGQVYELLRESIDYYIDASQLWFALVRPLSLANERLVVAYTLNVGGRDTVIAELGGTPDLELVVGRPQLAHLVWDPQITPSDAAFRREIRSVYRIGGDDVRRSTVQLRIVAGSAADQEKPPGGPVETYLQLFGLAQTTNPSLFDAANRIWPRPQDPNFIASGTPGSEIFADRFVIFPSLEPFARRGLASAPGIVPNDTIYRTPSEYLYTSQHPPSFYRLRLRYESSGGSAGTIALNAVQLRPGSERLTLEGRPLVRGVDYEIDYDLGRVMLLRPDTLSAVARRLVVRYEENPIFAAVPTSVFGLSSRWTLASGEVSFVTISQTQRSTFTRPPLGLEPQASLVSGVAANFGWNLWNIGDRNPLRTDSIAPQGRRARLEIGAEVAVSRPLHRRNQQAFVESFETEGGVNVSLLDAQWLLASQPALGSELLRRVGAATLDTSRATSLAFQNTGTLANGQRPQFTIADIDPQAAFAGVGAAAPEEIMWLSLYPLSIGGKYDATTRQHRWRTGSTLGGRRWRSIRTVFGAGGSGVDVSRGEQIEFWVLIDTVPTRRGRNPTLVLDFGDISENTVSLAPDSLVVRGGGSDSLYLGRRLEGFNRLDSERDRFSRAFNADVNDLGLAGDVVDQLKVIDVGSEPLIASNFAICALSRGTTRVLGDNQANCTSRNGRLDEEDIDQDAALNFNSNERERERVRRWIVDLGQRTFYTRVGRCGVQARDVNGGVPPDATLCWVQVRIPFTRPDDSTAGGPNLRRMRSLRLTMISGPSLGDDRFSMIGITRLRVVGAPWLKRDDRPLLGAGGVEPSLSGSVIASIIGTQDRDSTRNVFYESPPGVSDLPDQASANFGTQQIQINERSLRVLATGMPVFARAETFFRFPEGQKSVMGYRELRVWARGRGNGWGPAGDLQFFIKVGRDADNFYMYRVPASSGNDRSAWEPEVRVRFERFIALRARLESAFLAGDSATIGCTGVDSALVAASGLPTNFRARRWAVCEDGYMVYSTDPAVTPPNLASVQELAAGIVRVDSLSGSQPLLAGDTAEVWIDDIRLADVVNTTGYAAELTAALTLADLGTITLAIQRRDPNFRQLGESPSFRTSDDLTLGATWRLDRWLPREWGLAVPVSLAHRTSLVQPRFVTQSDIRGASIAGLRTPRLNSTALNFSIRREASMGTSWTGLLLDALTAEGSFSALGNRTEFQHARVRDARLGIDLVSGRFPERSTGAGPRQLLRDLGPIRLTPAYARFSTALAGENDRRQAFLKPSDAGDDPAPQVRGEERLWRSSTTVEWLLLPQVTARWDVTTAQDLRSYDGNTILDLAARRSRGSLLGLDVGVERERTMNAAIVVRPPGTGWLRPRLNLGSTYAMLRDPNNRSVSFAGGDTLAPQLPRRVGNTQYVTAAATIDPRLAIEGVTHAGSWLERLVRPFQPIELSIARNQLTSYDGVPVTPGIGYQFGLGTVEGFRSLGDFAASNAGRSTEIVAAQSVLLPGGVSIGTRVQRTVSSHWNRRQFNALTSIGGEQSVLPDLSLRWSGRPWIVSGLFQSIAITARALRARQRWVSASSVENRDDEVRESEQRSLPVSASVVTALGGISISGSYALRRWTDSLPGSVSKASGSEVSADVSRSFPLPASWRTEGPLRARVSFQETGAESFVSNEAVFGARSRLTDNGRRSLSLNLDTEVSETMTLSLQGSRVLAFDRNFNRRIVQNLITAVFQMQFFSGATR